MSAGMGAAELEAAIRAVGAERYHDKHPFHHLLHGGKLQRGQVQAWALNRYCYQAAIPRKDAALLSRAFDRDLRPRLTNRGSAAKHVYSREEIDACLRDETASLGPSDDSGEAGTSSSGSRTKASVMRNPRARTILKKLRGGRL